MKKTGQLLKDKREAAKLSISEVALATKINPKILAAIENGDESALPAKTFLKGFLKAYAVFLKIDSDEVLRSYQEELGPPPPERVHEIHKQQATPSPAASAPKEARRRMGDENSSGLRTAAVIGIVMLIGVIIGVRELIEKYQREKVIESTTVKVTPLEQPPLIPENAKPADAAVTPTTPEPAAATPAPAPATVEAAPVPKPAQNEIMVTPTVPPPAVAPVPPAPAPKVEEAKVTPPPAPAPVPAPAAPAKAAEAPKASENATADAAAAKKTLKNEIILEALDKVDVKFQIKGETKRISLGPTQVHTIHSDQPVTLDLSDGGAVNIILNGHERGVPGDLGKPKQIKIP
jgi:cytoskeleton protein RodZ